MIYIKKIDQNVSANTRKTVFFRCYSLYITKYYVARKQNKTIFGNRQKNYKITSWHKTNEEEKNKIQ